MAKYQYVAMDARGRESQGEVEAESQNAAVARIREKGLFPTSVTEGGAKARRPSGGRRPFCKA